MSATAAIPIRRRHRTDLPGPWRDYLAHGALPLIRVDDPEHPRSNYEATATAVLLRHGYDADEAWRTIQAAHPSAFTKTRKQGHSWWVKYVWNKAVADDDTFIPVGTAQIDPALAGAIHAAQDALEDLAWRLPARQRPALLLVGHAVLAVSYTHLDVYKRQVHASAPTTNAAWVDAGSLHHNRDIPLPQPVRSALVGAAEQVSTCAVTADSASLGLHRQPITDQPGAPSLGRAHEDRTPPSSTPPPGWGCER